MLGFEGEYPTPPKSCFFGGILNGHMDPEITVVVDTDEERALKRDWSLFAAMTFLFMFGFTIYMGVFQNFFRENLHGDELGLGGMESMREIPGLIAALMAGALVALAESGVAVLGVLITGIGIGITESLKTIGPWWGSRSSGRWATTCGRPSRRRSP